MKRSLITVIALAFPLVFGACGDDDDTSTDVAEVDSSTPQIDGGGDPQIDGGGDPQGCALDYADCAEGDYVDFTGQETVTEIEISGTTYGDNKCITVTVGTAVTFPAAVAHTWQSAPCNVESLGPDSDTPVTITFDEEGIFGYRCQDHTGLRMFGTVRVVAAE